MLKLREKVIATPSRTAECLINDLADYRPVSEIPSSPPLSPAPPYQSAPQSPEFSNHHEIDSSILHEVESPSLQQKSFVSRPGTVELPDTSEDPFRASLPEVLKSGSTRN